MSDRYVVKNSSGEYLSREPPFNGPVGWVRGQKYAWRFTENGARWTACGLGATPVRLVTKPVLVPVADIIDETVRVFRERYGILPPNERPGDTSCDGRPEGT